MESSIDSVEVPVRESRLGAITGYQGTIKDLAARAASLAVCNRERCFSQMSGCSSFCAHDYLAGIRDAVLVNHAPLGCAADAVGANTTNKWGEKARGWEHRNVRIISTDMNEEDTVFGAVAKLKEAVLEAYRRFQPKAIFVSTSCVSGVIGEDVKSALDELREELPVPLAPVFCEGFKSKVWASGFDAAYHAILNYIVQPPRQKTNVVNMVGFRAGARHEITGMMARFDLVPLFIAPFCTVDELARISESAATVSICGTLGSYIGNGLETRYGVPYVKSLQPHGIDGMDSWLRGLGQATGRESAIEQFIAEEKERIAPELAVIRQRLQGTRTVVGMGPASATTTSGCWRNWGWR